MPSISQINKQLQGLGVVIEKFVKKLTVLPPDWDKEEVERIAGILERLARAQKALIETQVVLFVEAQESDLDLPVLPLFVEERDEEPEGDGEPEPLACETCGPPGPKECVNRNPVWCPDGEPEPETE